MGVRLLEIDTRHTRDSRIVVHHCPAVGATTTGRGAIRDLTLAEVQDATFRHSDGRILELEELLRVLIGHPEVTLWIDIKDFGLENRYIQLLDEFCMGDRIRLISWIPRTVLSLRQLSPDVPLGLSCFCTARHKFLHFLMRCVSHSIGINSRPITPCGPRGRWADILTIIPQFFPMSHEKIDRTASEYAIGYNHSPIIPGLPGGRLLDALAQGEGAIGMFPYQAAPSVIDHTHKAGLKVYVYCLDNLETATRYLREHHVDVIFTNKAALAARFPVLTTF